MKVAALTKQFVLNSSTRFKFGMVFVSQVPMGTCWGDIAEGVRVEVLNSDTNLSTKVYWIAGIVKLAGKDFSHNW